jgi:hypothetical protein
MESVFFNPAETVVIDERVATLASNILHIYRQFEEQGLGVADMWVSLYVSDLANMGEYARWYKYPPREDVDMALRVGRDAYFNGLEKEAIQKLVPQAN